MNARMAAMALFVALTAFSALGRRYAKPGAPKARRTPAEAVAEAARLDTVAPAPADMAVAGFEKTLAATRESMFVTNLTARPVEALGLRITYTDMAGAMLHTAVHDVEACIPPGETRMVSVPSFDRQKVFYYHLSPAPARARAATPFQVTVAVTYICHPNPNSQ